MKPVLYRGWGFNALNQNKEKLTRADFFQATALVNSGLLLMAVMGLMFPAVLHFTHSEVHKGKSEIALSRVSSCIMLVAYASYLFFQLKSQNNLYSSLDEVCISVLILLIEALYILFLT